MTRSGVLPALALLAFGVHAGPSASHAEGLPPIECVEALRKARIERAGTGDEAARGRIVSAIELPGCELPALTELLRLLRESPQPGVRSGEVRTRLTGILEDPERELPSGLVSYLVAVPGSVEDQERLLSALSTRLARARQSGLKTSRDEEIDLLSNIVWLEQRLGRPREALAAVDRLLELDGGEPWRWRALDLALEIEDWEQVAARIEAMLGTPAAADRLRPLYAVTLARLGRFDELLVQLDLLSNSEAVPAQRDPLLSDDDPTDRRPSPYVALLLDAGWALRDAGRDDESEAVFRRILEIEPEQQAARMVLLHLYGSEQERAAHAAAVAARRSSEVDPQALYEEGSELLAAGDAATAADLLARAAPGLGGTNFEEAAWYNLGLAQYKLEHWESAAAAFGRAATLNPDRPESHFQRGLALAKIDRCAEAAPALERFLALRPDRHEARYFLARCYRSLGRSADAEREWALYQRSKNQR